MEYPIVVEDDTNGTVLVSFPDLPWVRTMGDTEAEALGHAHDALVTGIEFLIKAKRLVPLPTAGAGRTVAAPALLATKVALHNELLTQGINRAELGRRMRVHRPQVDRLVDVRHASRLDQLEAAFTALGASSHGSRGPVRLSIEGRGEQRRADRYKSMAGMSSAAKPRVASRRPRQRVGRASSRAAQKR